MLKAERRPIDAILDVLMTIAGHLRPRVRGVTDIRYAQMAQTCVWRICDGAVLVLGTLLALMIAIWLLVAAGIWILVIAMTWREIVGIRFG